MSFGVSFERVREFRHSDVVLELLEVRGYIFECLGKVKSSDRSGKVWTAEQKCGPHNYAHGRTSGFLPVQWFDFGGLYLLIHNEFGDDSKSKVVVL